MNQNNEMFTGRITILFANKLSQTKIITDITEEIKPIVDIARKIPEEDFLDLQNGNIEEIIFVTDKEINDERIYRTPCTRNSK